MQTTTAKKSISSAALIRLINDCRERQANSSGVSFPSQTFPCVDHAEIAKKAQELLGVMPKASSHLFSQRQAHSISSIYGPAVQAALVDFFEEQALVVPQVEPVVATKKQATSAVTSYQSVPARKMEIALPIGGGDGVSMSSVEIAELTGIRQDNVKRTIETLAAKGVISLPQIEEVKVKRTRRTEAVNAYLFTGDKGRRDSIIVVAQLCPEFTSAIMDRWQELEVEHAPVAAQLAASTGEKAPTLPVRKLEIGLYSGGGDALMTMSSHEISELTGSRHDNVKTTVERLAARRVISLPSLQEVKVQRARRVEAVDAYLFTGDKGRRDSIIVVAQLCPEFTATIVDRWQELETLYQQQTQATAPHGQMPVQMSQMLSMLSEGYGKIEQELQRLNMEVESLKASTSPLQRPAPKLRTKDPARIPGPQGWQTARTINSIRMSFSIAPDEIGLEHFYLYLHSLDSDVARREALRQALHFGIALDASKPKNFPENPRTITFKFTISENDASLKDVLDMLLALPDDKHRRAAIKRHLVAKSQQAVNVSVALVQQPALF